jgi:hypothetical protein
MIFVRRFIHRGSLIKEDGWQRFTSFVRHWSPSGATSSKLIDRTAMRFAVVASMSSVRQASVAFHSKSVDAAWVAAPKSMQGNKTGKVVQCKN